jgi:APA family basic amino acid/polyamine antiporter
MTGKYEQRLAFFIPIDFFFFGLTATCLFVLRRRDRIAAPDHPGFRIPGHPFSTAVFVFSCWAIVANTLYKYPRNSFIGVFILLLGLPVYRAWRRRQQQELLA